MVGDRKVLEVRGDLLLWPAREQQPDLWVREGNGKWEMVCLCVMLGCRADFALYSSPRKNNFENVGTYNQRTHQLGVSRDRA